MPYAPKHVSHMNIVCLKQCKSKSLVSGLHYFFSTVRPVAFKDLLLTIGIFHLDSTQQDKRRVTYKGLLIL